MEFEYLSSAVADVIEVGVGVEGGVVVWPDGLLSRIRLDQRLDS